MCGASLAGGLAAVRSERRRITVLFCDVVNSMGIAGVVDAEDLRDILVEYRRSCTTIIERAGGRVVQLFGDGILAAFGFPSAREDDARRAVAAAVEICGTMPALSAPIEQRHGLTLSVRIGLHTGQIVFDESAPGPVSQQSGLIGNALNIGARLQSLAPHNGAVISADTFDLVQGYFVVEPLGPQHLPGIAHDIEVYRIIGHSTIRSVFEARLARGISPMVGRDAELAALHDEWAAVEAGSLRSVLVTDGPGIGKSRLLYEFQQRCATAGSRQMIFQCSAQFENTAFYPIASEFRHLLRIEPRDDRQTRLAKIVRALEEVGIADPGAAARLDLLFADLAAGGGQSAEVPARDPGRSRRDLVQTLVDYVVAAGRDTKLLLIIEDLHWADPSTMEFVGLLCRFPSPAPVMVLMSSRPDPSLEGLPSRHMPLERIPSDLCAQMIGAIGGASALPEEIVAELVTRSDGVPLFLEELTNSVADALRSARTTPDASAGSVESIVPASLYASIMSRLDRLGAAKQIAQVGALIGRSFRVELLPLLLDDANLDLRTGIAQLVEAGVLFEHNLQARPQGPGTLEFKHELVRGAASESLLRSERRDIHARIAAALERIDADECTRHPEVLAHHYSEAGDAERALPLWELAGTRAVRTSANQEAVAHFRRAIRLVEGMPDGAWRRGRELDLYIGLAAPLMATKGYGSPEYDHAVARALDLSGEIADSSRVFPLVYGRWSFDQVTGNIYRSRDIALQYLDLAERSREVEATMIACRLLGTSLQITGKPREAAEYLRRAIALFDDATHTQLAYLYGADLKVVSQCSLAFAQWALGEHELATRTMNDAWRRSIELGHAVTKVYCCSYVMTLRMFSGQDDDIEADLLIYQDVLKEHRFPIWLSTSPSFSAFVKLRNGDAAGSIALFQQSIAAMEKINLVYYRQYVWMWLGRAFTELSLFAQAEDAFSRCKEIIQRTGECWSEAQLMQFWNDMRARAAGALPPSQVARHADFPDGH